MIPAESFPFDSALYSPALGVRPLESWDSILHPSRTRAAEMKEKAALLAGDLRYYFQALPGSEEAQREAVALLGLTNPPGPWAPLDAAGRQVQEDLLLLRADGEQELIAGQLCFANGWCLDEKLGHSLLTIHEPVPGYRETQGTPTARLLERLKPGRPVWRRNWSIRPTDRLDLSSRWNRWVEARAREVTVANALTRCLLRVERQTLAALPATRTVLFTIHTYQQPLGTLTLENRQRVAGVLATAPPELLAYKGLARLREPLLQALGESGAAPPSPHAG